MATGRHLIVNADDFGQSRGVNQGIIQAIERGIVTSASLMVRWPAAAEAAAYACSHPHVSVGLHIDLGEWGCRDGDWFPVYEVVPESDVAAVANEVTRQLSLFHQLVGRNPTHLDSHQHVHRGEPLRSILLEHSRRLGVPLRHFGEVHYCGDFYGQLADGAPFPDGIDSTKLKEIIAALPAGTTELCCHPGLGEELDSMYCAERRTELNTLCDPTVKDHLQTQGIVLCSFFDAIKEG